MAELQVDRIHLRLCRDDVRIEEIQLWRGHGHRYLWDRQDAICESRNCHILILPCYIIEGAAEESCRGKVVCCNSLSTICIMNQPSEELMCARGPLVRTVNERPYASCSLCQRRSVHIRSDQVTEIIGAVYIVIYLQPVTRRIKRPFFQTIPGRGGGICTMYLSKIRTLRISTGWTFRLRASPLFRLRCRG